MAIRVVPAMRRAVARFTEEFDETDMFDKNMSEEELKAYLEVTDEALYRLDGVKEAMDEVKRQFNHMARIVERRYKEVNAEYKRLYRAVDADGKRKFR